MTKAVEEIGKRTPLWPARGDSVGPVAGVMVRSKNAVGNIEAEPTFVGAVR